MAQDIFIKLTDVKGEAQDKEHKDHIDVLAWSWGMTQSGTMHSLGGGGSGKVAVQDLSFTKYLDKSTPVLMQYCSSGKQFKEALLTVRKAGGDKPLEFLKIKMSNVIVTSISCGGSGGDDQLTENVTLNFGKFETEYQQQKSDGSKEGGPVKFGWDIAANVKT